MVLQTEYPAAPDGKAVVFAPEKILLDRLRQIDPSRQIETTDYYSVDVDFPGEDIQKLSFETDTFAFLMCNHVLEHVPDDTAAILECARILKPGGIAVFTIPVDPASGSTIPLQPPDSNGHVRQYGTDVIEQFQKAFSSVKCQDMHTLADPTWKVRPRDYVFICRQ